MKFLIVRVYIDGSFNVMDLVGNFLSLQGVFFPVFGGNGPLWSLSYEVWFYLLAYAVGLIAIKKTFYLPTVIIFVMVACIFSFLDSVYLFCWLIGALAYIKPSNKFSWQMLSFSIFISIYSVIAIQIGSVSVSVSIGHIENYFPNINVARILLSVGVSIIIQQLIFLKPKRGLTIAIDKFGTVMAVFSYTLYLTHYPLLQFLSFVGLKRSNEINTITISFFFLSILMCLIFAWVLYLFFEKHTDALKNQIKRYWVS